MTGPGALDAVRAARRTYVRQRRLRFALCFAPPALYLIAFMVLPYANILQFSFFEMEAYAVIREFNLGNYARVVENPLYSNVLLNSLEVATYVTLGATLIGYSLAYFLAFVAERHRALLYFLLVVPLLTSFLLRSYIWKTILGRSGIINGFLQYLGLVDEPLSILLYNKFSVSVALVYIFIPFVALPVFAALENIPRSYVEASMDLGARGFTTFRRVILPLSMPGVVAGASFTFALSFGDFVTPTLLGGPSGIMISNVIIGQFGAAFDWPFGSALAVIVLAIVLATVAAAARLEGGRDTPVF